MSQVRDQNKEADRSRQGRSEQGRPIGPLLADQGGSVGRQGGAAAGHSGAAGLQWQTR